LEELARRPVSCKGQRQLRPAIRRKFGSIAGASRDVWKLSQGRHQAFTAKAQGKKNYGSNPACRINQTETDKRESRREIACGLFNPASGSRLDVKWVEVSPVCSTKRASSSKSQGIPGPMLATWGSCFWVGSTTAFARVNEKHLGFLVRKL